MGDRQAIDIGGQQRTSLARQPWAAHLLQFRRVGEGLFRMLDIEFRCVIAIQAITAVG